MSSNNSVLRPFITTPSLKRSIYDQQRLKTNPIATPQSLWLSRQTHQQSYIPKIYSNIKKQQRSLFGKEKIMSQQNFDKESEQKNDDPFFGVRQINDLVDTIVKQDLQKSTKIKEKKSYNHKYQEKENIGEFLVGSPTYIPEPVQKAFIQAESKNEQKYSKVNFLQGFLPEIGFLYYSIENKVFFFDVQTIKQDIMPNCYCQIQIPNKNLYALYGIQIFTLERPYFTSKKTVMISLHPYEADIWQFQVKSCYDTYAYRRLKIKSSNMTFPLPLQNPCKMAQSKSGLLYCADDKGKLFKIDFQDSSLWKFSKKELTMKKIQSSFLKNCLNTTKQLSFNVKKMTKSIVNYVSSYFQRQDVVVTSISFDHSRNLIIVFFKGFVNFHKKDKKVNQYLIVYNQTSNQLLYTITEDQLFSKVSLIEEIAQVQKLEAVLNNKFNFVLLLKSGKRIYLDIGLENVRKKIILQQPFSNQKSSQRNSSDISAFILKQTFFVQLIYDNQKTHTIFTQIENTMVQKISFIQLESKYSSDPQFYLYSRDSQLISKSKQPLINIEKNGISVQIMSENIRQVFYGPLEMYYADDQLLQSIKRLRPIDIFYSLFHQFHTHYTTFLNAVNIALPSCQIQQFISYFCQILFDTEGFYYCSYVTIWQVKKRIGIRITENQKNWKYSMWQFVQFKDIGKEKSARIIDFIVDLSISAHKQTTLQKQQFIMTGFFCYICKIFRVFWQSNINKFSAEACKIIITMLQQAKSFIKLIQNHLRCNNKQYIGKALFWTQRFKQFMLLVRSIPNLPNISLNYALLQDSEAFHKCLFQFLTKDCKPQIYDQLTKIIPLYATSKFTRIFKLYCQIDSLKDSQKILQICRNHKNLPEYFIEYLTKTRFITQAILLKQPTWRQIDENITYKQKMKHILKVKTNLQQKQIMLEQAGLLLRKQQQKSKEPMVVEQQELKQIKIRLMFHKNIIRLYKTKISQEKDWKEFILSCISKSTGLNQSEEIIDLMQNCLFDKDDLQRIVRQLNDPLLNAMYTFYYHYPHFNEMFATLVNQSFESLRQSPDKLCNKYKSELQFMICQAKLALDFNQIFNILSIYMSKMAQCQKLIDWMISSKRYADQFLYWPLAQAAKLGVNIQYLYSKGISLLHQSHNNINKYLYVGYCLYYLIRDYLPLKIQEYANILRLNQQKDNIQNKKLQSLLLL